MNYAGKVSQNGLEYILKYGSRECLPVILFVPHMLLKDVKGKVLEAL